MSYPMPYPEERADRPQPAPAPQPVPAPPAVARAAVPVARVPVAPAVTSAPLATPTPLTRPPDEPGGPPTGPDGERPRDRTGPSGQTSRLRIGWHTVPRAGLRRVTATPPAPAGLLLGRDQQQVPVPLRLFTPDPVRVTLVGGVWAAQLLIFRAFSVGVRVVVVTTEPRAWAGFGERATGQQHRLTVVAAEPGGPVGGTAQTPLLTVYDLGVSGPMTSPPLGPWHTQLTILRQLDRPGVAAVQEAGLVVLQRLGGDEAALAAATLRLRPQSAQLLQQMNDDMMALIGDGDDRYLFLHQTGIEQQYMGLPRR
ncbi:hypothetical protein Q0Z83_073660 [Actinoplanes sichuanensis]|uniref:Uncharacterized protein n=1 Tax=Actinoplanes sichuanensis TaxID=512349 RepID=A0ABW4A8G5_9ACTN|nr:hypothetical protein [Actinoplanes sichuanensis]BEL09175.1 hypothetical protein Q0Z83_073660 [Actinoplanes sichuanensis]